MRVLVAPDKFKGSLSAAQVAAHLAAGLRAAQPSLEVVELPVADGGDGTLDAAVAGGFTRVGDYARRGDTAVVELAAVCGLALVPDDARTPMTASSSRVGEVLRAALGDGARRVVLGVGGSASTDGGAGMLSALGARVLDGAGAEVGPGGAGLADVAALDLTGLDPAVRAAEIVLASDVDNPLYGPSGAAYVYAPQKGASPDEVRALDAALRRWADVVAAAVGRDHAQDAGAGAAGGVGFAALAVLGATRRPGIEVVLELLGFERATRRLRPRHHRRGNARRADARRQGAGRGRRRGASGRRPGRRGLRPQRARRHVAVRLGLRAHRPRLAHGRHGATGPAVGTDRRRHRRPTYRFPSRNGPLRAVPDGAFARGSANRVSA